MIVGTLPELTAQSDISKRKQFLEDILKINIIKDKVVDRSAQPVNQRDTTWMDWLNNSGELPPDFDQMPSIPFLPEPLVLNKNGKEVPVKTKEQWLEKREWIKAAFQHWISGTVPPPPVTFDAKILSERMEDKTRIQIVEMRFGPDNKARMTFELMIPEGKGPFPVYMTQGYHRGWAQLAVRRGYIGCVYAAADGNDDTQEYQALYPEYDFTALMRRAWGTSRVIDYLYTRKEVNKDQIAVTGHSRNGKLSLWAGAFDERITAVISSSSGTGGITPWRYSDPQYVSESLDWVCSNQAHWFHPRLRFFFGREDKLPVDQNLLISLIAPRILLMHYAVTEAALNPWANEQNYQSVKKVYNFLGAGENVNIFARMGEHAVSTRDLERCIDYLDLKFKRKNIPWEKTEYFNYTFDSWEKTHQADKNESKSIIPVRLDKEISEIGAYKLTKNRIHDNLHWLLGKEPPEVKPLNITPIRAGDWIDNIIGRPVVKNASISHIGPYSAMGDHLRGILYTPVDQGGNKQLDSSGKMPVVIFLHQYAYINGFAKGYNNRGGRGNDKLFQAIIDKGFAVLAFDMTGFGTRLEEGTYFYNRFPQWSKMGMMVRDVRACTDALEMMDFINSKQIFILGNTIGGSVGLIAAAQDERIAGVAVVSAVTPWRTSNSRYESLKTYSHQHGFIPRLGLYADQPQETPVDFAEIISCIAPRPLMIISPTLDRYADPESLKNTINQIKSIYNLFNSTNQFTFEAPFEINRMNETMNTKVANFFSNQVQ